MMLPIAAHFARALTEERAQSTLPGALARTEASGRPTAARLGRRRLAGALRRAADRLEPVTD
jgi:hypothetical protein